MSNPPSVTHTVDAEGVGWITFDTPGSRANVFTPEAWAALQVAVTALAEQPLKAVVLISAKEKIFIAGADLKWLARITDNQAAMKLSRDGQEMLTRLSEFKVPVVCAIHGACAGGGFEVALACHWRIASDGRETQIGLPEVGIGLIPGWGGCVRLPRLIGAMAAVEHILKASLVPAPAAQAAGLVDEIVPAAELKARAKAAALRLASEGLPPRLVPPAIPADFFGNQRKSVLTRFRGQPAPLAVLDVVEKGADLPLGPALGLEAAHFGGLATGDIAKNLISVFLLKDAGKKATMDAWFPATTATAAPVPFRTIGIIGAGVMGSGIAHWCALHGFGVIMCDTSKEAIDRGVTIIRELFRDNVKRGRLTHEQAHKMTGGIGVTTSMEDFEICDLIIEAIVEDVGAKQKLFSELTKVATPDCVFASNTSALPIEELMAPVTNPGRTVGLHFFNPVGRMPLVELVLSPHTTRETADRALAFVKTLGKTPVICRSFPGFFVTRALFFYLNEACLLWEQGVPTEIIDHAMRDWGWPMGPMRLIDEVGLDVTDFILREMKHYYPDRFTAATICGRMLAAGLRGRKNGASSGFYCHAEGPATLNPVLAEFAPRKVVVMDAQAIADRLNGVMIEETKFVLAEGVLKTPGDADLALLLGAGFPAYRGGLMRYARSIGLFAG